MAASCLMKAAHSYRNAALAALALAALLAPATFAQAPCDRWNITIPLADLYGPSCRA